MLAYFYVVVEQMARAVTATGDWLTLVAQKVTNDPLWMGAAVIVGLILVMMVYLKARVSG